GLLGACGGESEPRTATVDLSGRIDVPAGVATDAVVRVILYHAWALDGDLRHPVEFIAAFEAGVGEYAHRFDYPVDLGDGLLVYAWIDLDGDGTLCTPSVRVDRAGLTAVADFAPGAVTANIELTQPCAGPDWFFPPPVS
ncbi:MAG: hypothetical protein ACE5G3_10735, partial [Gammaproteobacteria bacterium]